MVPKVGATAPSGRWRDLGGAKKTRRRFGGGKKTRGDRKNVKTEMFYDRDNVWVGGRCVVLF